MARYTTNGLPWGHGLGKDVTDCNTAQEVMKKEGLELLKKVGINVEKFEL